VLNQSGTMTTLPLPYQVISMVYQFLHYNKSANVCIFLAQRVEFSSVKSKLFGNQAPGIKQPANMLGGKEGSCNGHTLPPQI
jgi:hypothetical protein